MTDVPFNCPECDSADVEYFPGRKRNRYRSEQLPTLICYSCQKVTEYVPVREPQ